MSDSDNTFGKYEFDETTWVKFEPRGYPFRLRKEWAEANDAASLALLLGHIEAWSMLDDKGLPVPLPAKGERTPAVFEALEIEVCIWMIRKFTLWLFQDLTAVPKAPMPASTT